MKIPLDNRSSPYIGVSGDEDNRFDTSDERSDDTTDAHNQRERRDIARIVMAFFDYIFLCRLERCTVSLNPSKVAV